MRLFQIEQSSSEFYTSHSGLALVGLAINRYTPLNKTLRSVVKRHGIPNVELIRAYLGLLCVGKSDFDALENVRDDRYFQQALGIRQMPSAARLRQRFDEDAQGLIPLIDEANMAFIANVGAPITALFTGHVALDMDGFPMDNSRTQKEGVSRTYKGHDGYTPMGAWLGQEGWNIGMELREGSWHGQKEFGYVLDRVLPRARALVGSTTKLLLRLDGAHDAADNRERLSQEAQVDFLIKWNPRQQDPQAWLAYADQQTDDPADTQTSGIEWSHPREGKRVALFSQAIDETYSSGDRKGQPYTVRRVMRITERRIDKRGQSLLIPDLKLEGWWTSLDESTCDNEAVLKLYRDHATAVQFHSELKTDLDLERLPSGKFVKPPAT